MIADMAQTLQDNFPFAEFSAKHGKSSHEVFEAFSVVVQMPLFEYSAKGIERARMKKGFQERIREYREKERDVRRGHRAEEKERGKGKGKGKGEEVDEGENEGRGRGAAGEEMEIMVLDEDEGEEKEKGRETGGGAERRDPKSTLNLVPAMRASGQKPTTPTTTPSSSAAVAAQTECEHPPAKSASASTPARTPARTQAPTPAPTPKTPKRNRIRADAIAPTGQSNGAPPVLELRNGIYVLRDKE